MFRRVRRTIILAIGGLALGSRVKGEQGTILGIPFDWRRPTGDRAKRRLWNPDEPRLLVPRVFGLGWDINFARLLKRKQR